MTTVPPWPIALRRYLLFSGVLHLMWEVAQLPLYTLWQTGTFREQAFAVFHCTLGDLMIAGLSLFGTFALLAPAQWPDRDRGRVLALAIGIGVAYTIFSEWLNVNVRGSWAYNDNMPTIPPLHTGLTPVLQWFVVPALALTLATKGRLSPRPEHPVQK